MKDKECGLLFNAKNEDFPIDIQFEDGVEDDNTGRNNQCMLSVSVYRMSISQRNVDNMELVISYQLDHQREEGNVIIDLLKSFDY